MWGLAGSVKGEKEIIISKLSNGKLAHRFPAFSDRCLANACLSFVYLI